jgi:hypothetical protein
MLLHKHLAGLLGGTSLHRTNQGAAQIPETEAAPVQVRFAGVVVPALLHWHLR